MNDDQQHPVPLPAPQLPAIDYAQPAKLARASVMLRRLAIGASIVWFMLPLVWPVWQRQVVLAIISAAVAAAALGMLAVAITRPDETAFRRQAISSLWLTVLPAALTLAIALI